MCVAITDSSMTLDRVWDSDTSEEIIYLLPSFKGEKGRRYYKFMFNFQMYLISNPLTQMYASLHYMVMSRIANFGMGQALMMKKKNKLKSYSRWKRFADLYERRSRWAENIINSKGDGKRLIDISTKLSPEEVAKKKEEKETAQRLEKERKRAEAALKKLRAQESQKAERAQKEAERRKREKEAEEKLSTEKAAAEKQELSTTAERKESGNVKSSSKSAAGEDGDALILDDASSLDDSSSQVDLNQSNKDFPPGWLHDDDENDDDDDDDDDYDGSVDGTDSFAAPGKPATWKANEKQLYERMLEVIRSDFFYSLIKSSNIL